MSSVQQIQEIKISYRRSYEVDTIRIRSPQQAYNIFKCAWDMDTIDYIESFYVLLLDRGNSVLGISHVSKGGTSSTVVDAKVIFGQAILANASYIILAHNHPSGQLKPSQADIRITTKLYEAGKYLDIEVYDHLIVGRNGFSSMKDEGYF